MNKIKIFSFLILISLGCHTSKIVKEQIDEDDLTKRANMLAQENIIVDGHIDLPYRLKVKNFRLEKEYIGIPVESEEGDFDFVRARKGGLDAPFMSIYIPARHQTEGGAKALADTLINMVEYIANENQIIS